MAGGCFASPFYLIANDDNPHPAGGNAPAGFVPRHDAAREPGANRDTKPWSPP